MSDDLEKRIELLESEVKQLYKYLYKLAEAKLDKPEFVQEQIIKKILSRLRS